MTFQPHKAPIYTIEGQAVEYYLKALDVLAYEIDSLILFVLVSFTPSSSDNGFLATGYLIMHSAHPARAQRT